MRLGNVGDYVGVHVKLQVPGLVGHLELAVFRGVLQVDVGIYLVRQFLRYYYIGHLTLYSVVDREKLRIVKFDIV